MLNKEYKNGWSSVPHSIINDKDISMKAKLMWVYINSKPSEWEFSINGTCAQMKESRDAVRSAIKELESCGLLECNEGDRVSGKFTSNIWTIRDEKTVSEKPCRKNRVGESDTSNNNKSKNKESNNKEKDNIKEVLDHLNNKLGTKFRTATGLKTRFEEGFTVEDAKKVIDIKFAEWIGDEKMKQYIRPVTLFSNKMDQYLNQEVKVEKPESRDLAADYFNS